MQHKNISNQIYLLCKHQQQHKKKKKTIHTRLKSTAPPTQN